MKTKYVALIGLICLIIGFLAGRETIAAEVEIKYIQGEKQSDSINIPDPEEAIPTNPILPIKADTIYVDKLRYITQKVDTAAIIADYITQRDYNITAFESKEYGTLKLFPTVQYNQLADLRYEFTPIYREITIRKEKVWQPFVSGSYSTLNYVGIGGGVFYHNIGIEYQFQKGINASGHSVGLKYRF